METKSGRLAARLRIVIAAIVPMMLVVGTIGHANQRGFERGPSGKNDEHIAPLPGFAHLRAAAQKKLRERFQKQLDERRKNTVDTLQSLPLQ